jgi:hypothetical protein
MSVPARRVSAELSLNRSELPQTIAVETADEPGVTDRDVQSARSSSCMTTSGTPGSERLARASTRPARLVRLRRRRRTVAPRSSQSPCGPADGTGRADSTVAVSASITAISAGSRMFTYTRSRSASYVAYRGRPDSGSSAVTRLSSRLTTDAEQPSPRGSPRLNA